MIERSRLRSGFLVWRTVARVARAASVRVTAALALVVVAGAALPSAVRVAAGSTIEQAGSLSRGADAAPVVQAVIALGALYLLQQLVGPAQSALVAVLGQRADLACGERLMEAVLRPSGIAHLEDPDVLDSLAQARGTLLGYTPATAIDGAAELAVARLGGLVAAAVVAGFRWWLAVGLVVGWRLLRQPLRQGLIDSYAVALEQTSLLRRANYLARVPTLLPWAQESRIFGFGGWLVDRLDESWLGALQRVWAKRSATRGRDLGALAGVAVLNLAAFVVLAAAAASGGVGVGELVAVAASIPAVSSIGMVFGGDLNLANGTRALDATEQLAERVAATAAVAAKPDGPAPPVCDGIHFESVSFTYPNGRAVLHDLNLSIPAGASLGIVGANGAGKTTLVKLLAKLYEPSAGRITADGVALADVADDEWRRRLAVIFQDFVKYPLSARDNVGFGALERLASDADLARAAELAGADGLLAGLPARWETILSRNYTNGVDLSGGQWQRVAVARCLFAVEAGASVVVLDEPTAKLDIRAEAELFSRLIDVTRGRTTILVSHRFGTLRQADRLVVIDGGRVTEHGTHDELIARGGSYARMYELQASHFRRTT